MSKPFEDLLKDSSESFENGNYFLVTITELELGSSYPIQFKWKYKDGTLGKDWSASYNLNTPIKTNPADPALASGDVVGGAGFIKVTWNGNDASGNPLQNIDRVDVHISGTSFGDGTKPAGSFKVAGTQTFTAEPGVYIVQLKSVTINGATSFFSSARTVTVTSVGEVIQTPTLPSGLSVATAPFAVTVNWAGTYSSGTFTGFKSIDIYAVSSNLGSSVTSGITDTNLVGSLTVNNTPNKINISLDNLRQALGLTNNSDVYNTSIFYYFNATNRDGTKFGSPTYTRINSSSVIPTKANFIDLASGVISIENLVAGNGNFSSWLRTGTAGGARIELSAVDNFTNGGHTVQKGLTAYSSGNSEVFKLDLATGALTINGSGTFSGNLSAAGGTFTGTLSAATGSFSGTLTASGGSIGGIIIAADALQNGATSGASTFRIDSSGKARFGSSTGNAIIIDPSGGIYHTTNGSSANGTFSITTGGVLTATSATITGTINANAGNFTGAMTVDSGTMKIGKNVNGLNSGIFVSANNFWYNDNTFSLGGGIITGTSNSVAFNLSTGNSITFSNMPATDDDGWAGDPTVTIRDNDSKLVKGRRFIFDSNISGNTLPTNPSSSSTDNGNNSWFNTTTRTGEYLVGTTQRPVKAGDILMIQE